MRMASMRAMVLSKLGPIEESSPYLLQHAKNPVNWQWNSESQKAKIKLLNKINVAIYELSEGKPGI